MNMIPLLHHKPEPDFWKHLKFYGLESFRLATVHLLSDVGGGTEGDGLEINN